MTNKTSLSYISILGLSLLGIFAPFPDKLAFDSVDRQLQLNPADAPASGMSKAQCGLSETDWIKHVTTADQVGCANENNCNQCRPCGSDADCWGILKCLRREGSTIPVPGCIVPASGFSGSVCYLEDAEYYPPAPELENPLITSYNPRCTAADPCDQCAGMCNLGADDQCKGDLKCSYFNNNWPTGRKNCAYNGVKNKNLGYCMPAEDYVEYVEVTTKSADFDPTVPDRGELIILPVCPVDGCPVCTAPMNNEEGCTADTDCAAGLTCYGERTNADKGTDQVTGCSSIKIAKYGYCYTKDPDYKAPDIPHLMEPTSGDSMSLTNVLGAPEECAIYAVDHDKTVEIPFSGSSDVGISSALYHKVTYIYVVDASQSTKTYMKNADCGDANSDGSVKHPIDCEILAVQVANEAANAGGNVDLVGLVQFNNVAQVKQELIEPWTKISPYHRDPAVVHKARTITPKEATNFQAGVELACKMARSPINDNEQTVVIFVSDGAPNLGTTSKDVIQNNCGNAIFQTYAVTEYADCDLVDELNLRPGIDSPDTLRQIAEFSGGTCTQVTDVGILPELLVQLEKSTWDGVKVKVNGIETNATVNYSTAVPFEAPNSVTYYGSVPLGPGEHSVCLEAISTTSGVEAKAVVCKTVAVEAIAVTPEEQQVDEGENAQFTVRFLGLKPGCDSFDEKDITVELCDEGEQVLQIKTGFDGSVIVTVPPLIGKSSACYKICHTAANGSKSCTTSIVDYLLPGPVPSGTELPDNSATAIPGGVNGDPLIMGLSGQLFKFNGRSGAWYSAVSTPSLQWNLKINNYELCPDSSDSFVSGAGFNFFENGTSVKKIEISVANPYHVDVGCGDSEVQNCLGAGSLELIIDGVKHIVGGDYVTEDKHARITAFNTFYQCSRKWYDFDVRPESSTSTNGLRSKTNQRRLSTSPSVIDIISGLKKTMIDPEECQKWISDRQQYGDLFLQAGHYSTVIVATDDITFHLEYKQENERCNAHSIDVWISSVDSKLLAEQWEGIIGETKNVNYVPTREGNIMVDRMEALKFVKDEEYEVDSPYAWKCKGCIQRGE